MIPAPLSVGGSGLHRCQPPELPELRLDLNSNRIDAFEGVQVVEICDFFAITVFRKHGCDPGAADRQRSSLSLADAWVPIRQIVVIGADQELDPLVAP